MKHIAILGLATVLLGCGGGGAGAPTGDATADWTGPVQSIFALSPAAGTTQPLMPTDRPAGQVGLSGGFGARLGGTDRALFGATHMLADFDAARVRGYVDQGGIYQVATGVQLSQANPQLQQTLTGRLLLDGAIEVAPPAGEGMWFDATYTGTLTGPRTTLGVSGRTDRGAFVRTANGIGAVGSVTGTSTVTEGGAATVEILREGSTFVQQVSP